MSTTEKSDAPSTPRRRPAGIGATLVTAVIVVALAALVWQGPTWFSEDGVPGAAQPGPAVLTLVLGALALVGWRTAPRRSWRVVDIVVASVLGVAVGLLFTLFNLAWNPISGLLGGFAFLGAVLTGPWLLGGVVGGLVIRRPGAAVFVELVAAVVSALIGNQWGFFTVIYGLVQGLGAEVVLAVLLYRQWGLTAGLLAGLGAGAAFGVLENLVSNAALPTGFQLTYLALAAVVSGAITAGLGGWALTRALARTGALAPLASGRNAQRV
ncbi:energy-coupling factor transport system substrate-specific component [Quadrisphaera granulorum]|uniref:Energy-coupling factor transport system substrate-specific component n=1 Tax=Quadrisphaera granulorum TaxID=317664 RepID=A0A316AER0_9ACTN|nr:ECF transporter S component [Quadrisphaera granulorum]PWJ55849.1 energy-coupling factor transport system substrate-specific component [Quadrisphaera granulorum]SZE95346.1 energy-coupling factor transport system substrate-specific component [Quadrisphaera granulorum]